MIAHDINAKRIASRVVAATPDAVSRAAQLIRQGDLVAFPTETVYGLGAHALDRAAVEKIYAAKERPYAIPLIVHVADVAMARALVVDWPPLAEKLAERFWPGPLTMTLEKAAPVSDLVTAGLPTVGIRIPSHPVALALIRAAGVPIAAPSANRFTEISPTRAQHVERSLGDRVAMILDGGQTDVGIESTVVALHRDPPAVLRPGMISNEELARATGVAWEAEADHPHLVGEPAESPGTHPRHYSPRTPFYVLPKGMEPREGRGRRLQLPSDPHGFAQALYAALHDADTEGWDWIAVDAPPDTPAWRGIHDRLRRASAS